MEEKITPPYEAVFIRKKQILSERKSGCDAAKILMFCNLMFVIKMFKWLIFLISTPPFTSINVAHMPSQNNCPTVYTVPYL